MIIQNDAEYSSSHMYLIKICETIIATEDFRNLEHNERFRLLEPFICRRDAAIEDIQEYEKKWKPIVEG